jgi:putative transposase
MANKVSFIDAFDCEVIAYTAVSEAGISGSDVRNMMLAAVERRFGTDRAPHLVEHLSDNGSCYTAKDTRDFATAGDFDLPRWHWRFVIH